MGGVPAPLNSIRAQSRYGVAFVRTLCAQAGFGFTETSLDEDTLAVDCTLEAPAQGIRVQVRSTTQAFTKKDRSLAFGVADHWRAAWEQNANDLYFVVVRLSSPAQDDWISHPLGHTHHDAIGYWARIQPTAIPPTVRVYEAARLTHFTLASWEHDVLKKLGGGR
jgi:hypothetical protein